MIFLCWSWSSFFLLIFLQALRLTDAISPLSPPVRKKRRNTVLTYHSTPLNSTKPLASWLSWTLNRGYLLEIDLLCHLKLPSTSCMPVDIDLKIPSLVSNFLATGPPGIVRIKYRIVQTCHYTEIHVNLKAILVYLSLPTPVVAPSAMAWPRTWLKYSDHEGH